MAAAIGNSANDMTLEPGPWAVQRMATLLLGNAILSQDRGARLSNLRATDNLIELLALGNTTVELATAATIESEKLEALIAARHYDAPGWRGIDDDFRIIVTRERWARALRESWRREMLTALLADPQFWPGPEHPSSSEIRDFDTLFLRWADIVRSMRAPKEIESFRGTLGNSPAERLFGECLTPTHERCIRRSFYLEDLATILRAIDERRVADLRDSDLRILRAEWSRDRRELSVRIGDKVRRIWPGDGVLARSPWKQLTE
ncbi:MAG: hypothetical protein U1D55_00480 [Phycisphaerae bacterium]